MSELTALTWALGSEVTLASIADLCEKKLLALLRLHRLVPRFLDRLLQEPNLSFSFQLQTALAAEYQSIESANRRHLEALSEICDALSSVSKYPPISIKGGSLYILTGEQKHLRHYEDIDLFHPNLECLSDVLETLGYQRTLHHVLLHEYATFSRNGIKVEAHRFLPVWSYPENIFTEDLIPAHHPDHWHQSFSNPGCAKINFSDIWESCTQSNILPNQQHVIPSPDMSALILSAHEFGNYLSPPFRRHVPIKLGTLADIRDFTADRRFDRERFLYLANTHHCKDALQFIGRAMRHFLGENPFETLGFAGGFLQFPRMLTYSGGWAQVACTSLVLPEVPKDAAILDLVPLQISLKSNPEELVSVSDQDARVITHSTHGNALPFPLPFHLHISGDRTSLVLTVIIPELLLQGEEWHIATHSAFYEENFHCLYIRHASNGIHWWSEGNVNLSFLPSGYRISACLSLLPDASNHTDWQALMLSLSRWTQQPQPFVSADSVQLVPIQIKFADAIGT